MADSLFNASELYNALKSFGLLPQWSQLEIDGGEYHPDSNIIVGDPSKTKTIAHELTHASQNNLLFPAFREISSKKDKTKEEQQFLDAMSKIMLMGTPSFEEIKRTATPDQLYYKDLTPKKRENTSYNSYRTSVQERQAFGVGNMSGGLDIPLDKGGLHYDPSMATEFSILLELFKNLPETTKKKAVELRKKSIETSRKEEPNRLSGKSFTEDIFADPFAPTIK
jgi:hypothetical protein